ncbi:thiol peroxidase, atypical 2-Cys peroxiredoxin [Ulvibacter sp. MAR_2010_11]|uniref:thiol peroxidase n=1 Tax=Ulvibacter sp. MAR_2010_11 TaxID=1250229 RepID=UPI000C2BC0B0|nr:thiol peroxidase [Ulvibacter sp. MAR_2010_11]PKA84460.1 thiol peroxidase, atypical 2-Cys peroxiredoxin [Ulvibacter sp. MAR_2010_11]
MASITLDGNPAATNGNLPAVDSTAPNFTLTATNLSEKSLHDYDKARKIVNIFPSVGTGVCAAALRKFNEKSSQLQNTKVLCISKDLPFAQSQFCAAEGLENVEMLSDFKNEDFGNDYGVLIVKSAFTGLLARAVLVLDENNTVIYSQLVPDIAQEPDYEAALNALK